MNPKRTITFNGQTKTMAEWADSIGLSSNTLAYRLNNGWSVDKALTTPLVRVHKTKRRKAKKPVKVQRETKAHPAPIANLMRANMAAQREFTRTLRQFNRELMLLMSRPHDMAHMHAIAQAIGQPDPSMFKGRGVVSNFAGKPSDQSLPSAQEMSKLEKFQ